ncbi:MAG: hypothetical protein R3293_01500 [Candidatus Promineifilaceae bacterium]|nr:hypothetical protein [Candidatus Promineifilaceae bacterium]
MIEPELIEIIEGPTPEFQPTAQSWLQSLYEGPEVVEVAMCQLRTASGESIKERCELAWQEKRKVLLDFPDEWGLRQQLDVVALRLSEVDEGELLTIWVAVPFSPDDESEEEDEDEDNDIPF